MMSSKEQIGLRRKYWEDRKSDFVILLSNWLKHEKKTLAISADILYDEYLSTGIETFELSEYKYGKDLQKWFDNNLRDNIRDR
ncbi:hypothetical protein [Sulfurovum sp.]|uniref:hypothetical protein n=1 Tax=Sulfurovum sp. TaxID=1969726 RepID=UPI003564DD7D